MWPDYASPQTSRAVGLPPILAAAVLSSSEPVSNDRREFPCPRARPNTVLLERPVQSSARIKQRIVKPVNPSIATTERRSHHRMAVIVPRPLALTLDSRGGCLSPVHPPDPRHPKAGVHALSTPPDPPFGERPAFWEGRGAWRKKVASPCFGKSHMMCDPIFSTVRQLARNCQVFGVTSCPGSSTSRISPGHGGRHDALPLARGYGFRAVGTRRPRSRLPLLWAA